MTLAPTAGDDSIPQTDPDGLVAYTANLARLGEERKILDTLFGKNRETDLQTLRVAVAKDHTRSIVYILMSPHGLTHEQWEEVIQEAYSLFVGIEEGVIDRDLSDFTKLEIEAYEEDNLRGLIVLVAAQKGWMVLPVENRAWGQSEVEI